MEISDTSNVHYLTGEGHSEIIAGVYYNGVMYYDFSKVQYINNSGVADLIDLVKSWMELGTEVRFLHVNDDIKQKLINNDLQDILYCE